MSKKTILVLVLVIIALILLFGRNEKSNYVADNPLTEDEIIELIQNEVYKKTEDEVDAKIINKENYEICTFWLDGCHGGKKIEGIYSYDIEITNKSNNDMKLLQEEMHKLEKVIKENPFAVIEFLESFLK